MFFRTEVKTQLTRINLSFIIMWNHSRTNQWKMHIHRTSQPQLQMRTSQIYHCHRVQYHHHFNHQANHLQKRVVEEK